jgi:hypothetical protein
MVRPSFACSLLCVWPAIGPSEEQDRLRPGVQRGDTAATCDAPVEDDVTRPRNVPTLLSDERRRTAPPTLRGLDWLNFFLARLAHWWIAFGTNAPLVIGRLTAVGK